VTAVEGHRRAVISTGEFQASVKRNSCVLLWLTGDQKVVIHATGETNAVGG